jgi:hypothetical protein
VDQSVISRAVTVAGGRFAPGHLGELTQQVPFEMVDAVLEETCRVERRVRDLPARVVVYLLLAGCLFAELGYGQVWDRMAAGLDGLDAAAPTASAMTQARRRLGPGPLRELFALLRGPSPGGARWRGLLVAAIDGTIMTVADSAANLAVYSKQRGGPNGSSSYPMLRCTRPHSARRGKPAAWTARNELWHALIDEELLVDGRGQRRRDSVTMEGGRQSRRRQAVPWKRASGPSGGDGRR